MSVHHFSLPMKGRIKVVGWWLEGVLESIFAQYHVLFQDGREKTEGSGVIILLNALTLISSI